VLEPFTMQAGPHPDFQFKLFWQPRRMSCASGRRNRMKLKNFGRAALALAASAVMVFGMTSCTLGFTVGYLFVTGSATGAGINNGQIASYKIKNNDGTLKLTTTVGSGGPNQTQVVVNSAGSYLYVLNAGLGTDANPEVARSTCLPSVALAWSRTRRPSIRRASTRGTS
jgi:hypothetical protein